MKKLIFLIILIFVFIAGYEFYGRHELQIVNLTESLKSGAAVENIKTEIFTPGGLRAKIEGKTSFLTRAGVIELTNQERSLLGRLPLKENKLLTQAAMAKVKDMFAGKYFEHISPLGKGPADLAKAAGYVYITVGENLALGNYENDAALVAAWMNSPGHRANIMHSGFTEIGAAVLQGVFEGKTTWLAVQEFGRPASDCPKVDDFLRQQVDLGKLDLNRLEEQISAAKQQLENWPDPGSREEVDAYNKKVSEYNDQVKIFNNRLDTQKDAVSRYNAQVKAFNACIAK